MFLLTEEELFSNLTIFNETCVKWQRKTGKLGMQETYTVSGTIFEIGSSFMLINSSESAVHICFVGFVCMVICLALPSELPRNLKVAGLGKKKIPVLKLGEKLKSCWGPMPVNHPNMKLKKHFRKSLCFSEIPL